MTSPSPNNALQRTEAGGRLSLAIHVLLRQPLSLSLGPLGTYAHPAMSDTIREQIQNALQYACTAQSMPAISRGRTEILALPRTQVLEHIEVIAATTLTFEEWEYRRLLEVYEQLDAALLKRLVAKGAASDDPDIREAAEDFRHRGPAPNHALQRTEVGGRLFSVYHVPFASLCR